MMSEEEAMSEVERIIAERDAEYERRRAEVEAGPHHIRKRAGKNLGNQFYSHAHRAQFAGGYRDPMAETLCGEPATTVDLSWAETRYAKNLAYVTCERCKELR